MTDLDASTILNVFLGVLMSSTAFALGSAAVKATYCVCRRGLARGTDPEAAR